MASCFVLAAFAARVPVPLFRASPEAEDLVLKLDAACSGTAIDAPSEVHEPHELTCVDIDTFLANF